MPDALSLQESRERRLRGRLVTAVVAGVLVVAVVAVGLAGGFRPRTYPFDPVTPGTVVTTGPYEVSITRAKAEKKAFGDGWSVDVVGTARTTGATSILPDTGSSAFLYARSTSTREVQPSQTSSLGEPDQEWTTQRLTPGLPAAPWVVTFDFDQSPGDQLLVVVFDQHYVNPYIFGDELGWQPEQSGHTVTVPVTVSTE